MNTKRSLHVQAYVSVLILLLLSAWSKQALAQGPSGVTAVGGQIGDPSGLSIKMYQRPGLAYEVLAAWNLGNFYYLSMHGALEQPFEESPLHYYWGPGIALGVEKKAGKMELVVGACANVGVNFFTGRFEVFLQMTPRITLLPDIKGNIGGGVGLRYYVQ